ncbi:MAG: anti-sigma factor [Acetobacteraceae bacterium]
MSGGAEERDLLAAEYVLGTLDAETARELEREAAADPALAALLLGWEQKLAPLARVVASVPPPAAVWARIEASGFASATGDAVPRPPGVIDRIAGSLGFWRISTAGALALAGVLAGLLVVRPTQTPMVMGTITPTDASVPVFVAEVQPNGALLIRALSPVTMPAGKSLELWALPAGATVPMALGVLPPHGMRVETAAKIGNATELMISLEPAGGSPSGKPTGPVMYQGRLSRIE